MIISPLNIYFHGRRRIFSEIFNKQMAIMNMWEKKLSQAKYTDRMSQTEL